ncbi:conserved Plasmodium protein, unknown function [Plasmodium knowlesi strain H]|uniref:N-acetylgalactosaminide beta-1,3-galactosyltransferase n=3 Tax=Plasmodium knowlesi TaxID=5850 RepID=A0A5K1U952_PLAKH|nr:conserved Plasmodium protein, unknown function [Plasmodium knowlesi strain H]OTN65806.1 Uncharacterized protein PKNOH_S100061100 [Plasmodium knowlesi]CAA9987964.1 conserved Plasmodium protein, unknown function [Plasmodium knowlesi strain H]SBO22143.1 conserved Plasmodium protein, unknown function [Plasmodium knowlesi strain H]SBO29178.1 conserved Plasmodium protein, unknown function [Plasmodium knowlesi strain H]VVS77438.1 conserved Plasmodium protein, unknown function [Plasmodium knowlesi |eukprot:XP_002258943.1 hypothetical protein, conserved in Plasmodium species [Plasmodium knowlesi strain H]
MSIMRRIFFALLVVSGLMVHCIQVKDKLFKGIKRNTTFLVLNEPIVDLGLAEGLFHSLLFDLEVGDNLYTLDENLLNQKNLKHTNIFHLLMDIYKQVENSQGGHAIRYIFLCTSFTRVHPLNLELLLRKFNKYIYNGHSHEKGDIDVGGILREYNEEVQAKRTALRGMSSVSGSNSDTTGRIPAKDIIERMMQDQVNFLSSDDKEGSDQFVNPSGTYKGFFIGYGFSNQVPSQISGNPSPNGFFFPSINSGIIMDIILLRRIYNHLIKKSSEENLKVIKDNVHELSNYIGEHLQVNLTPFENACITDKDNVFLVEHEGGSNYDVYRYYLVMHLFRDYKKDNNVNEADNLGGINTIMMNPPGEEGPRDAELAELIITYFNLAYPISTCASYSIRSKKEAFVDYDNYHLMSIENEIKLEKYIKETEDVHYNSIDEYKTKLNQINQKYDMLFDETQRIWNYKNILLAVVTSAQTEHRIAHVKNTYDNKKNIHQVFNSYHSHGGEDGVSGKGDEQDTKGNLLNHDFLKSAFENEKINMEIIYFSDKESKEYDETLHLEETDKKVDSPNHGELWRKEKNIIYYLYEEYVRKNSPINFFFICHDDTFVNVKTLIDVINLTRNECTHSKRHMFRKYVKAFDHMDERESQFLENFDKKYLQLYRYLKTNFVKTIDALKKYDYVPSYCKGVGAGKSTFDGSPLTSVPLYIGKRYSHNSFDEDENSFFHYLAGGAGIVLNAEAVKKNYFCKGVCDVDLPSGIAPHGKCDVSLLNDAAIGQWAKGLGIVPINFEGFYPKAPEEYPAEYLNTITPVSFHKLNEGKTVEETKEAFFRHLVNPTQPRNKTNHKEEDMCVDYLDRNYKNTMDIIFHFFFYVNKVKECKPDESIIKTTERIYDKMGSSKKFSHLFDMTTFFTRDVEDMLYFQKRSASKGNLNNKKESKGTYTNNYVERKDGTASGDTPDGHRQPGREDMNNFGGMYEMDEADDLGEEDHLSSMDDFGSLDDLDEEEQFDDDDYDYEKYLDGIEAHKKGSGRVPSDEPEWGDDGDDNLNLPPEAGEL